MKLSQHETEDIQSGPKLRNINDEGTEIVEEPREGADIRLKLVVAALILFIVIIAVKGNVDKLSLTSQLDAQQKTFKKTEAEASKLGITKDENGDLTVPEIEEEPSDALEGDSTDIEQRNAKRLDDFTAALLTWKGRDGYNAVRQTLINDWGFDENSQLLSTFMAPLTEDINANMSRSTYDTFVLTNDGKTMSYFLKCTVYNTINDTSAPGTVGILVTVNEDGSLSDVTAQTLS